MPRTPTPDAVPIVPGYGKPRAPIYAGNLPVDTATRGVKLFYIFTSVLSQALSPHAPVVLWLQGGGGASPPWGNQTGPFALGGYAGGGPSSFGMLCEKIGPFSNPDNATGTWVLKDNPLTWNRFAHLLFIDQPAGVGLSSFSAAENGYAANGTMLGHDLATALVGFFARHPELKENPLFIFGESYAGHYVPHVANYILEHAHESFYAALAARFAGVGLGDVCPGEEHTLSLPDLVHGLGYLSPAQLVQAHATGSRCQRDLHRGDYAAAFKSCEALEVFKGLASGGIHDQDSRTYANYSSLSKLVNVDGATQEGHWNALANAWLDEPAVRSALHANTVGNRSVSDNQPNCTRGLWEDNDNARSTIGLLPRMLTELKVLFYNGNFDVSCNFLGTERLLASLGRWFAQPAVGEAYDAAFGAREQRWFTLSSKMAGYVRHVPLEKAHFGRGALTHVIVQGAGHLAPRDQPARVSAMVGAFLRGGDIEGELCDQAEGVCRASDVALRSLGDRCALLYNCSHHGACTEEGRCQCDAAWAGADCADPVQTVMNTSAAATTTTTWHVRPGGWAYHRVGAGTGGGLVPTLYLNGSGIPQRALPRPRSGEGLLVYLAPRGPAWPPADPLKYDLAQSFARAWRLDSASPSHPLTLPALAAGDVIGVHNGGGDGFHGAVRGYSIHFSMSDDAAHPPHRASPPPPPPPLNVAAPPPPPPFDPDAGIVINWKALDKIVKNYTATPPSGWLLPPLDNCSLPEFVAAPSVLNLGGLAHEQYRPLFCPWLIKPFRDPFDMAVTEAGKWPVYRKLLGAANVSVGLPVAAFFGVCACRIYANATMALEALSAYDPCWHDTSELERCNAGGHHAPWEKTNLTKAQFDYLMRNASYADEATPHL